MTNQKETDAKTKALRQEYDKACKILLSNMMVLAHISKAAISEFKDIPVEEIAEKYIEGLENDALRHPYVKYIHGITNDQTTERYDICFCVKLPSGEEIRKVFFNIEAQDSYNPGYPKIKRGIYYASCMIANQYGTEFMNSEYEKIQKADSMWICMDPPEKAANSFARYHVTEKKITGNYHEKMKNYDLLSVDMISLGGKVNERYEGIFKMLDCLLSKDEETKEERIRILKEEFGIDINGDMKGAMGNMCTFGEALFNDTWYKAEKSGMAKGEKKGLKKGRKEGRKEGMQQGMLLSIRNLMKSLGWSAEEAMRQLQVPEEERETYEVLLKQ